MQRLTKKAGASRLHITLGRTWQQFVPNPEPGTELLGTLSRGAQVGALARLADGRYVQINGDWVTPLNSARIEHALRSARVLPAAAGQRMAMSTKAAASADPASAEAAANAPSSVTVRVRKRRAAQLPGAESTTAAPAESAPSAPAPAPASRRIVLTRRTP
jgi:hypothetical protein